MASTSGSQPPTSQTKRAAVSSYTGGSNASLLIEKAKGGLRRSTPDSEALASSDDELDQRHHHFPTNQQQPPRSTRRASWLNDVQQGPPRKASLSGAYSAVGSNPTTPATEPTSWPSNIGTSGVSTVGRGHSNSASFVWGSAI